MKVHVHIDELFQKLLLEVKESADEVPTSDAEADLG